MIIGRADNKNLPILLAGLVILDFAGKVDLVKVKLECRLQLGTLSVCCALRELANTTKVHFNPKFKQIK